MSVTLESLNAQIVSLRAEVAALSIAPKAGRKAAKAAKDPMAPKKEATWWIKATQHIRGILKPTIDSHNSALAEGEKKLPGTTPVQVSRILKNGGLLSDSLMPEDAQILAAFATFLKDPLPPKTEEWKASAGAKAASVSSASSAGKKPKAPKAELTEEEAAAARATKAAKAKATREANKAKKAAAEAEEPVAAVAAEAAAEGTVEAYEWKADIGKGMKTYERIDYQGNAYVYTEDGEAYIGVWEEATKKINKKIPDFQAE